MMNLLKKLIFVSLIMLMYGGCKKNAFKENKNYEILFKGTLNSYDEGYVENYSFKYSYVTCTNVTNNYIEFYDNYLQKSGSNYEGDICVKGTNTCTLNYHLKGKLKYKWSKFRFVLVGDVVIYKYESTQYNPNYFTGTFTMQPTSKK